MTSFFDKLRSGASKATGMAAFEASKLRRITSVQSTIRTLQSQLERSTYEVGRTTMQLYQDGNITQSGLTQICERVQSIQKQISEHETELEAIRAEVYTEPGVPPQYGRLCPNGHGPVAQQVNFCEKCGAQVIEIPLPVTSVTATESRTCPNCHSPVPPEARFCTECGQSTSPPNTFITLEEKYCVGCGVSLLPEAVFCAVCGQQVVNKPDEPLNSITVRDNKKAVGEAIADAPYAVFTEEEAVPLDSTSQMSVDETDSLSSAEQTVPEDMITLDDMQQATEDNAIPDINTQLVVEEEAHKTEQAAVEIITEPTIKSGNCPSCQTEVIWDAPFCAECGFSLGQTE